MMIKPLKSTNPIKYDLIIKLQNTKRRIWKNIAEKLNKRRKNAIKVNLNKINKFSKENEVIIVPGKVLGEGSIDHKITLAAFSYSESAKIKLLDCKTTILSIDELLEKNPSGANVKIIT